MLEKIASIYEIDLLELLADEKLVFNQKNRKGDNNGMVINNLPEKLIEQYEKRLAEKDERINEKDTIIAELKERLKN